MATNDHSQQSPSSSLRRQGAEGDRGSAAEHDQSTPVQDGDPSTATVRAPLHQVQSSLAPSFSEAPRADSRSGMPGVGSTPRPGEDRSPLSSLVSTTRRSPPLSPVNTRRTHRLTSQNSSGDGPDSDQLAAGLQELCEHESATAARELVNNGRQNADHGTGQPSAGSSHGSVITEQPLSNNSGLGGMLDQGKGSRPATFSGDQAQGASSRAGSLRQHAKTGPDGRPGSENAELSSRGYLRHPTGSHSQVANIPTAIEPEPVIRPNSSDGNDVDTGRGRTDQPPWPSCGPDHAKPATPFSEQNGVHLPNQGGQVVESPELAQKPSPADHSARQRATSMNEIHVTASTVLTITDLNPRAVEKLSQAPSFLTLQSKYKCSVTVEGDGSSVALVCKDHTLSKQAVQHFRESYELIEDTLGGTHQEKPGRHQPSNGGFADFDQQRLGLHADANRSKAMSARNTNMTGSEDTPWRQPGFHAHGQGVAGIGQDLQHTHTEEARTGSSHQGDDLAEATSRSSGVRPRDGHASKESSLESGYFELPADCYRELSEAHLQEVEVTCNCKLAWAGQGTSKKIIISASSAASVQAAEAKLQQICGVPGRDRSEESEHTTASALSYSSLESRQARDRLDSGTPGRPRADQDERSPRQGGGTEHGTRGHGGAVSFHFGKLELPSDYDKEPSWDILQEIEGICECELKWNATARKIRITALSGEAVEDAEARLRKIFGDRSAEKLHEDHRRSSQSRRMATSASTDDPSHGSGQHQGGRDAMQKPHPRGTHSADGQSRSGPAGGESDLFDSFDIPTGCRKEPSEAQLQEIMGCHDCQLRWASHGDARKIVIIASSKESLSAAIASLQKICGVVVHGNDQRRPQQAGHGSQRPYAWKNTFPDNFPCEFIYAGKNTFPDICIGTSTLRCCTNI